MRDNYKDRAPFLEWVREETVIEDTAAGTRTIRTRKFIRGTWVGQSMFAACLLIGLFLIPSQDAAALWRLLSGLF